MCYRFRQIAIFLRRHVARCIYNVLRNIKVRSKSGLINLFIRKVLLMIRFVNLFCVCLWLLSVFMVKSTFSSPESPPPPHRHKHTHTFNMIINYDVHGVGGYVLITNNVDVICGWGGHKIQYFVINSCIHNM